VTSQLPSRASRIFATTRSFIGDVLPAANVAKTRLKLAFNCMPRAPRQILASVNRHRRFASTVVALDSHMTPLLAYRAWLAAAPLNPTEHLIAGHLSTAVDIFNLRSTDVQPTCSTRIY